MTMVYNKPPQYQSYLLRCWEMRSRHPDRPATWRFSLEDPQTGEKRRFADLDALIAFLRATFEDDNIPANQ